MRRVSGLLRSTAHIATIAATIMYRYVPVTQEPRAKPGRGAVAKQGFKSVGTSLKVDGHWYRRLEASAAEFETTTGSIVRELIVDHLEDWRRETLRKRGGQVSEES